MGEAVLLFFVYSLFLIYLGLRARSHVQTIDSYFLESRNLPWWWGGLSLIASWFGAASTLESFDRAVTEGTQAFWWIGAPTIITIFSLYFMAPWIRTIREPSLISMTRKAYGTLYGRSIGTLYAWYMAVLVASQAVALGKIVSSTIGTSITGSIWIGIGIVFAYALIGGFKSVVLTDMFQLGFLSFLTVAVFIKSHALAFPSIQSGNFVRGFFQPSTGHLLGSLGFIIAWSISPIAWQRISSVREPSQVRKTLLICLVGFFILYPLIVLAGAWTGVAHTMEGTHGTLLTFMKTKLSRIVFLIAWVGLASAVMSTLDTALNTGGLVLTTALPEKLVEEKRWLLPGSCFLIGILGGIFASWFPDILLTLGLASEIIALCIALPVLALRWERVPQKRSAWSSTILGLIFVILSFVFSKYDIFPFLQWPFVILPGLCATLVVYLIMRKKNHEDLSGFHLLET